MNAINAFTATGVNGAASTINVYEEWAMRVGEYGALDNNESIELILREGKFNGDPVTFTLLPNLGVTSNNMASAMNGIVSTCHCPIFKSVLNHGIAINPKAITRFPKMKPVFKTCAFYSI